jgi:hypothetical protein
MTLTALTLINGSVSCFSNFFVFIFRDSQ